MDILGKFDRGRILFSRTVNYSLPRMVIKWAMRVINMELYRKRIISRNGKREKKMVLSMAIEMVDFPIEHGDFSWL